MADMALRRNFDLRLNPLLSLFWPAIDVLDMNRSRMFLFSFTSKPVLQLWANFGPFKTFPMPTTGKTRPENCNISEKCSRSEDGFQEASA